MDEGGALPESALFVVFGATGDLSHRKIFPALFDLHAGGILPPELKMVGFARRPLDESAFRLELRQSCLSYSRHKDRIDELWEDFASRISYIASDLDDESGYEELSRLAAQGTLQNALFYLAVGPEHFGTIAERLGKAGLGSAADASSPGGDSAGWRRLVVEKPYGRDAASAKELTNLLQRNFAETDIFRIDHYLGKETVQNLLYLRFANSVFEPIWNRTHIESIEISVFETEGIGQRGGYYDTAGAARDMMQNHLIQLMCLTTMEPPASLDPESIRDEKVKVLRSVSVLSPSRMAGRSIRGQYAGYRSEAKVGPGSVTETFASLRLELDNWRFSGVPITLRTGKAFAERYSQIVIRFRRPPAALFAAHCGETLMTNTLTIRVQPDEGVWLRFNAKVPGLPAIKASELRFSYREVANYMPEAYERLIADALSGDSTLFIRADESEHAWAIIDALEKAWALADPNASPEEGGLFIYPIGSAVPESGI
jgi:glucose-6-phosphate 1-dehydrogenase